jgi:hypothetical protein
MFRLNCHHYQVPYTYIVKTYSNKLFLQRLLVPTVQNIPVEMCIYVYIIQNERNEQCENGQIHGLQLAYRTL